MIEKRPDWTVSRQRFWGVPMIGFYCDGCGKRLEDYKALRNVVKWFEKEGADAWYQHSPEELLPRGTKCPCGASKWRKEFFFQAECGIRGWSVTGVQTCALPI